MTTYIYNDTRTIEQARQGNANATTIMNLAGTKVILGRDTFWTADITGTSCLAIGDNTALQVAGQLYADSSAILNTLNSPGDKITVTADAILGAGGSALYLSGRNLDITNAGTISGSHVLTHLNGVATERGVTFLNTGLLDAEGDAITLSDGQHAITNTGTIASGNDAIRLTGAGRLVLTNGGLISGTGDGVTSLDKDSQLIVYNQGTIDATTAVSGYDASDAVYNTGTIIGVVELYGGNDTFDTGAGTFHGAAFGNDGNDTLLGSAAGDQFFGNADADRLVGNAGDDVLDGGAGADTLDGGAGLDTASYYYSGAVVADLMGTIAGTGDAAGDIYTAIENLEGSSGNDLLYGSTSANTLTGNDGADSLDGRGGGDTLIGGGGDDTYYVDNAHDVVVEGAGKGEDTVYAAVTHALADNVENVQLTGNAAINAFGNSGDNVLIGNAGANVLDGGRGIDTLTGGGGGDTFRLFYRNDDFVENDTITDFTPGSDHIQLSRTAFSLGSGSALNAAYFYQGAAAHDGNDHILYDPSTGLLRFDPDGTGNQSAQIIAQLTPHLTLASTDFILGG